MTKKIATLIFLVSCSSFSSTEEIPRMQDRTMRLSEVGAAFEYRYLKTRCEHPERLLFKNCSKEWVVESFDLNDQSVRKMFIDMDFKCQSSMRFQY